MRPPLTVKYEKSTKGLPLAIIDRFPGGDAEMDAEELRELARQCLEVAEKLERMK